MSTFTLQELEKIYKIELEEVIKSIKNANAKEIVLQLPEGMKPWAIAITDFIQEKLPEVQVHIWMGDCFGACDVPQTNTDLLIQFGHAPWDSEYEVTAAGCNSS